MVQLTTNNEFLLLKRFMKLEVCRELGRVSGNVFISGSRLLSQQSGQM
jgi:hypothetical protein